MAISALHIETWGADTVTDKIVTHISGRKDTAPEDLAPPLYEAIDPEAIAQLFQPTHHGQRRGQLTFTYHGYTVEIASDGDIQIYPDTDLLTETNAETQVRQHDSVLEAVLSAVEGVSETPFNDKSASAPMPDGGPASTSLYEVVDIEALATLSSRTFTESSEWQVSFPYRKCNVTITSSGAVEAEVTRLSAGNESE